MLYFTQKAVSVSSTNIIELGKEKDNASEIRIIVYRSLEGNNAARSSGQPAVAIVSKGQNSDKQ